MSSLTDIVTSLQNIQKQLSAMGGIVQEVFPLTTLTGSKTFNPPNIVDASSATTTVPVVGAIMGQFAVPSFSLTLAGLQLTAYVSAPDTVTCVFANLTGGAVDLASGTLAVRVFG